MLFCHILIYSFLRVFHTIFYTHFFHIFDDLGVGNLRLGTLVKFLGLGFKLMGFGAFSVGPIRFPGVGDSIEI